MPPIPTFPFLAVAALGISLLVGPGAVGPVPDASRTPSVGGPAAALNAVSRQEAPPDGEALYEAGCASCHGGDGAGSERVQLEPPVPDFSDCGFASREPDADWIAVAHQGGPVRGFSETMPAFGEAFDVEQLQAIMGHIRTFCESDAWPRGELNLPRPLFTEKAYPEDELVWTTSAALEGPGAVLNEVVYERRFGARHQLEVVLPFGAREVAAAEGPSSGDWQVGLGDVALGWKTTLAHGLESRAIFSGGGEVKLPTGDEDEGFGAGVVVFEPYLAFGKLFPADAFLHAQAGAELAADASAASHEAFWRAVLGKTFTQGRFGRAWTPMLELLGSAEFEDDETPTSWDLVPQMQVTLNTRQHVMLNVGVRLPLTDADERSAQLLVYLLWDWFDGGFFDGW